MSAIDQSNLRYIDLGNAAKSGDIRVIDLGLGALGGYAGFDIDATSAPVSRDFDVVTYIQPDVVTNDVIQVAYSGYTAASGGDDHISFFNPNYLTRPNQLSVTGGPGNDTITGFAGGQNLRPVQIVAYGGSGDDAISGNVYDDVLSGDGFDNFGILSGGRFVFNVPAAAPGNDTIYAFQGDDTLSGGGDATSDNLGNLGVPEA